MSKQMRQDRYEYLWKRTHRKVRRFKRWYLTRQDKLPLRSLFDTVYNPA